MQRVEMYRVDQPVKSVCQCEKLEATFFKPQED